jgi:hypothetical protein
MILLHRYVLLDHSLQGLYRERGRLLGEPPLSDPGKDVAFLLDRVLLLS